jgi:proteasome lid subunit RPN8/RPN11
MRKTVFIRESVVESLLTFFREVHPKEGILLLRGKEDKARMVIEEVIIPPIATHGEGFSLFSLASLPIDFSIIGVAHSHPSGVHRPSLEDLNMGYAKLMVIVTHPYSSEHDIAVFDTEGKPLLFEVVADDLRLR